MIFMFYFTTQANVAVLIFFIFTYTLSEAVKSLGLSRKVIGIKHS